MTGLEQIKKRLRKYDRVYQAGSFLHCWAVCGRKEAENVAHANMTQAVKNRMKIDEHRSAWIADDIAEQERRAEGELEDFVVRKQEI